MNFIIRYLCFIVTGIMSVALIYNIFLNYNNILPLIVSIIFFILFLVVFIILIKYDPFGKIKNKYRNLKFYRTLVGGTWHRFDNNWYYEEERQFENGFDVVEINGKIVINKIEKSQNREKLIEKILKK